MPDTPLDKIRNFCIIAHIDHGKSTLADRILEVTGAVTAREARPQTLDAMDLERERGITIKAKAVHITYKQPVTGELYQFNLIDTPGHVDFNYEVSRSLAACEGAILLVDSTQGVQAQTVANAYLAIEAGLEIIPAVNKVDMQSSRPEEVKEEMNVSLAIEPRDVMHTSGKTGAGVEELLDRVISRVPAPKGDPNKPLRALIFDSIYDDYKGVVMYVRLTDGRIRVGDKIRLMATNRTYEIIDIGQHKPKPTSVKELTAGDAGYVAAGIKTMADVKVGDTMTLAHPSAADVKPLPGYKEPLAMVFCGIYPTVNSEFPELRKALERLRLNDSSFTFQPETSEALGFGFRCGFLGLLHMDIVQERLERESNIDIIQTAPNVTYEIVTTKGEVLKVDNPAHLPEEHIIEEFREPIVRASIVTPADSIGAIMKINDDKRAKYVKTDYLGAQRVILQYEVPLGEIIFDYYDMLKSASHGYATLDYELKGYVPSNLVKLRILVQGIEVDALSSIVHRDKAEYTGRELLKRLRKEIPRHLFEIPLQAAIGGKIIARENIAPMRKNVTAKCYGGDITRKRKLLEKQKEGKKRMKSVGNVEIPQRAFLAVLGDMGGNGGDED
jgi:GTP-binding protein LepA